MPTSGSLTPCTSPCTRGRAATTSDTGTHTGATTWASTHTRSRPAGKRQVITLTYIGTRTLIPLAGAATVLAHRIGLYVFGLLHGRAIQSCTKSFSAAFDRTARPG